jgi:hypothetical protein
LKASDAASQPRLLKRDLERLVREALASIRFGTVFPVAQDGRVIQVDKNEKIHLNRQGTSIEAVFSKLDMIFCGYYRK